MLVRQCFDLVRTDMTLGLVLLVESHFVLFECKTSANIPRQKMQEFLKKCQFALRNSEKFQEKSCVRKYTDFDKKKKVKSYQNWPETICTCFMCKFDVFVSGSQIVLCGSFFAKQSSLVGHQTG